MKKNEFVGLILLSAAVATIEIIRHGVVFFCFTALPLALATLYSIFFLERIRQRPWIYCFIYFVLIMTFLHLDSAAF